MSRMAILLMIITLKENLVVAEQKVQIARSNYCRGVLAVGIEVSISSNNPLKFVRVEPEENTL